MAILIITIHLNSFIKRENWQMAKTISDWRQEPIVELKQTQSSTRQPSVQAKPNLANFSIRQFSPPSYRILLVERYCYK